MPWRPRPTTAPAPAPAAKCPTVVQVPQGLATPRTGSAAGRIAPVVCVPAGRPEESNGCGRAGGACSLADAADRCPAPVRKGPVNTCGTLVLPAMSWSKRYHERVISPETTPVLLRYEGRCLVLVGDVGRRDGICVILFKHGEEVSVCQNSDSTTRC